MAKLLVSVRSIDEAHAALAGGADIIDIKEPRRGPLGRAQSIVWSNVRAALPRAMPVSVALGELSEWQDALPHGLTSTSWEGIAYCKIGLAGASADWAERWRALGDRLAQWNSFRARWVSVVYLDWRSAGAPSPETVIAAAQSIEACDGILFDTWDKSRHTVIGPESTPLVALARDSGLFVALAGSIDVRAIERLANLDPDIFAVRGSACRDSDRLGCVDAERVAILAAAAHGVC